MQSEAKRQRWAHKFLDRWIVRKPSCICWNGVGFHWKGWQYFKVWCSCSTCCACSLSSHDEGVQEVFNWSKLHRCSLATFFGPLKGCRRRRLWRSGSGHFIRFAFEWWSCVKVTRACSWCESQDSLQSDWGDFGSAAGSFLHGLQGPSIKKDLDVPSSCGFILLWHSKWNGNFMC